MKEKLAIDGGVPVRQIPFPSWPVWDEKEEMQLKEVLHSGNWGMLNGCKVHEFERAFADFQQARYGICIVNGTAALEVALRVAGVEPGDEVITTPYTFIATINAALLIGAVPIFVDIDPETLLIDPHKIEAAITARTRAILPVHIGGQPADMDAILSIAKEHGLAIVEDACQAWGAEWRGHRVGALGDLGTFSFQASKNITAGEGGIIVTNRADLADLCWSLHNVGRKKDGQWYEHIRQGWNYRMTEWQAAVLIPQLERAKVLAERRSRNACRLSDGLSTIPGIQVARIDPRVTQHAWHIFIFLYQSEAFGGRTREEFLQALRAEGIPCAQGYPPLNQSPALEDGLQRLQKLIGNVPPINRCPMAEKISLNEAVWLTQNMLLGSEADIDDIVAAVSKIQRCFQ